MTPPRAFGPGGWLEAEEYISLSLDRLRTDQKRRRRLDRRIEAHVQESFDCGATREQISEALDVTMHASPEDPGGQLHAER
jgi:hypothetical protein